MQEGDGKAAADKLDNLAQDLNQMQEQLDSLETLDEMMSEIADAKNSMNCREVRRCRVRSLSGRQGDGNDRHGRIQRTTGTGDRCRPW